MKEPLKAKVPLFFTYFVSAIAFILFAILSAIIFTSEPNAIILLEYTKISNFFLILEV